MRIATCAFAVAIGALCPAIAAAQSTSATATAAEPATAADPATFDPLDADGWPRGLTLEDLRALPECGPGGLGHTPGAAVTCRPAVLPGPVQWSLGVDWTSGATFGDVATTGGAHGLGVELDFALSRAFQVGARYELLGVGRPTAPGAEPAAALSNQLFGVIKARLFTDEVGRSAWTLGAGAGYALRGDGLGGAAPIVRASLARESGFYIDDHNAMGAAIELAYEQSLGDAQLSAVLASVRLGFETQIREPHGLGRPAPPHWRHTMSYDIYAGPFLGLGLGVGLRASPRWSLQTSGAFFFDITRDGSLHGLDGASWTGVTGPRLLLGWPEQLPLYVQAQGGAAWVAHDPDGALRPIAIGELGFHALVGCASAVDLGAWLRADDVDSSLEIVSGGLALRVEVGGSRGAAGGAPGEDCVGAEAPHLATPYVPPPTPVATSETTTVGVPDVRVPDVGGSIDVHAGAGATVEVPRPEPVVIEVELGAAFYGVQVAIDPRLLPIDRLRGAGWIDVQLSGPADALASFQGALSAQLGRSGVHVDGWAAVHTGDSFVRARFTIWPPGTRP